MQKYILDTNVYIQAHMKYYNHEIAPSYWDVLKSLGTQGLIRSPRQVKDEITTKSTWLHNWKKDNPIFPNKNIPHIMEYFSQVSEEYEEVKQINIQKLGKKHQPSRDEPLSDADIFVIATALFYKENFPNIDTTIVTKENNNILGYKSVKIPHVCTALNIRCIDDFAFLKEVNVLFEAKINEDKPLT